MPSAAPDDALVRRFKTDLEDVLAGEGLSLPRCRIGIALSGGPDSIALLLLAAAAVPGGVEALTVDHGLRAEAADEAAYAGRICAAAAVPHAILRVSVDPAAASLQAAAREARYLALTEWARRQDIGAVLTAHHADDQAETLLMRMARGSGLAGLSGIRPIRRLSPDEASPVLARPLLGWRKAELEVIVAAAGIEPIRDPSNDSTRFDRTAARRLLAGTDWLDPARVSRSASHLREANAALEWATRQAYSEAFREEGDELILSTLFPQDIRRRLLLHLLAERFAKQPDGPAVERAMKALDRGETVTLADILCRPKPGEWRFRPAPPRRSG